jgi:hypothetical protein
VDRAIGAAPLLGRELVEVRLAEQNGTALLNRSSASEA